MTQVSRPANKRIELKNLSVVVGEPQSHAAREIERQLSVLGMKNVRTFRNMDRVRHNVGTREVDLFLCNMDGNEKETRAIFRGIRNQDVGRNPFLVMIPMVGSESEKTNKATIDSGPDDFFYLPFRRDDFVLQVRDLAWNRRKFVAVSSYVGPTRWSSARPGGNSAEEFEVPNPVRAIGTGVSREDLRAEITSCANALNLRKLNSDVSMIRSLADEIIPDYRNSNISEDFLRRIELMNTTIEVLCRRAGRLHFANLVSLCELAGNRHHGNY